MDAPSTDRPLTAGDVYALADVLNHLAGKGKVRRYMPDTGNIITGTLRHLCGPDLGTRTAKDVRDEYVRVTSDMGTEYAWPLAELARQSTVGELALDTD
jgi:hypothetical protein